MVRGPSGLSAVCIMYGVTADHEHHTAQTVVAELREVTRHLATAHREADNGHVVQDSSLQ